MHESKLSANGRTTIPREVRELIGAGPGTRLVWHLTPSGQLIVRAKAHSVVGLTTNVEAHETTRSGSKP